jgi:hypothetical protein
MSPAVAELTVPLVRARIGRCHAELGRWAEAAALEAGVTGVRAVGSPQSESLLLRELGRAQHRLADVAAARRTFHAAAELCLATGDAELAEELRTELASLA